MPLGEVRRALTVAEPDPAVLHAIAADLFLIISEHARALVTEAVANAFETRKPSGREGFQSPSAT
jgi:hypothetical protein